MELNWIQASALAKNLSNSVTRTSLCSLYPLIVCPVPSVKKQYLLYLHPNWSQYVSALPKQSKLPSFSCFLWMIGEMTSLKQGLQSDDVKSSGPHEITASFFHSLPHLIHLTRNLFISFTIPILRSCRSGICKWKTDDFISFAKKTCLVVD